LADLKYEFCGNIQIRQLMVRQPPGFQHQPWNDTYHEQPDEGDSQMQDLVATPVRPPATLPTGQNHGEQQSLVVMDVSTPVRFAAPPPDMLDENDLAVELGTTPACPHAPLPGHDNTDEKQGPVANGVEKAKCTTPVCDYHWGCDKPSGKAGR
jgi:hypothetical protein